MLQHLTLQVWERSYICNIFPLRTSWHYVNIIITFWSHWQYENIIITFSSFYFKKIEYTKKPFFFISEYVTKWLVSPCQILKLRKKMSLRLNREIDKVNEKLQYHKTKYRTCHVILIRNYFHKNIKIKNCRIGHIKIKISYGKVNNLLFLFWVNKSKKLHEMTF